MQLPLDARRAPFKSKYLESETPMFNRWMLFGIDPDDGTHQVNDGTDDVVIGLSEVQAQLLVDARDRFVNDTLRILNGGA